MAFVRLLVNLFKQVDIHSSGGQGYEPEGGMADVVTGAINLRATHA